MSFGSLFSFKERGVDVPGDIEGYGTSTLQEVGYVNPVLISALWKLL